MKKYISLILCCIMLCMLVGCDKAVEEAITDETIVEEPIIEEPVEVEEQDKPEDETVESKEDEEIYGRLDGVTYSNEFFELTLVLPEGGEGLQDSVMEIMAEQGAIIAGDDATAEEAETYFLFGYFEHPLNEDGVMSWNIIGTAELASDDVKADSYQETMLKVLKANGIEAYESESLPSVLIDDQEFVHYSITMDSGKMPIRQDYFISEIKGYRVIFVESRRAEDPSVLVEKFEQAEE